VIFVDIFQGVPLALLAGLCMLPRLLLPWWARRDFRRHPNLSKEYLLRGDSEGVHLNSDASQGIAKWSVYTAFRETHNLFLVFTGTRMFMIIPKRAFLPVQIDEFRNLLQTHIRTQ